MKAFPAKTLFGLKCSKIFDHFGHFRSGWNATRCHKEACHKGAESSAFQSLVCCTSRFHLCPADGLAVYRNQNYTL
jgi:hypothetical protein